jgi:hypothetical protein
MNAAVGVRTPAAVLAGIGRGRRRTTLVSRFLDGLKESRRREARFVIARYAHLLPFDHPLRAALGFTPAHSD